MRKLLAPLLLAACHGAGETDPDTDDGCVPEPIEWPAPVTTLTERVVMDPGPEGGTDENPALPEGLTAAREAGLGGWHLEPGEPWTRRDDLAPGHGGEGEGRKSLAMFLHQTDAQLADTESPTRLMALDDRSATQSAARPQEVYEAHALDALIRAVDTIAETVPVDFALATGDDADSTQENELRWFAALFDGTPFRPDSGDPDSQLDENCRDPLADMVPRGVDFPWYAVAGNHDVLVQGNFPPATWADDALGSEATLGTRDLSQPGGPITFVTVADPARRLMDRSDIAAVLLDSPATPGPVGHGFTDANVRDDTVGWVAHPAPGLALISVDANPQSTGDGELTIAERDGWLIPQLEAATADGDLIVLTSHYALGVTAMEGGGTVGDLLLQYPNVVLVVAGHWHENRVAAYGPPGDPAGFWEVQTASTVDWPAQGRFVELVDNGDGTLSIWCTLIDVPAPEDTLQATFRELAAIDLQSGWRLSDGTGGVLDRNVELVQALPAGWSGGLGTDGVRSVALP